MKRLIRKILVFAFLLCVTLNAFSYDFEVDGIYYNYNAKDQTAIVTDNNGPSYVGNIIIPEYVSINGRSIKVTSIGGRAFYSCENLETVKLPESIISIGNGAFCDCANLRLINIPSSVIEIGSSAFYGDTCLTIERTDDAYTTDGLNSLNLSNVRKIGDFAFCECEKLEEVTISASTITRYLFGYCTNLKRVNLLSGVHYEIMITAFPDCSKEMTVFIEDKQGDNVLDIYDDSGSAYGMNWNVKHLYLGRAIRIPKNVSICDNIECLTIGEYVSEADFGTGSKLETIYSKSKDPDNCKITFNSRAYVQAKLYVPIGCKEKYSKAEGWKNFFQIEEMDVDKMWNGKGEPEVVSAEKKKCEKPSISYSNGKLTFTCATEGAKCMSTITDTDVRTFSGDELQLCATYTVKAYATAAGYDNSETVTATLCWLDAEPKTEGMTNDITSIKGDAVLIQSYNGTVFVSGACRGEKINIYSASGVMVASTKTLSGTTALNTNLKKGEIAIVKIGSKSVKVLMQ